MFPLIAEEIVQVVQINFVSIQRSSRLFVSVPATLVSDPGPTMRGGAWPHTPGGTPVCFCCTAVLLLPRCLRGCGFSLG